MPGPLLAELSIWTISWWKIGDNRAPIYDARELEKRKDENTREIFPNTREISPLQVLCLEQERTNQEKCITSYRDTLQLQKRENEEMTSRLTELENICEERDKWVWEK